MSNNNERQKVLEILASGDITAEEAARLLDSLDQSAQQPAPPLSSEEKARMQGKKLRVQVNGDTEEDKNINVNVSIPLVIARYADNIIANFVPNSANEELRQQGIDLRSLNIGALVDAIESLEEDIVNADINQDDVCLKVRVYVE